MSSGELFTQMFSNCTSSRRKENLYDPGTRRFLFKVVEKRMNAIEEPSSGLGRCIAILGPRNIGKTILLMQLCKSHSSISSYIDISTLKSPVDYNKLFQEEQDRGKTRLFLDEISKIATDDLADFVSAVKLFSSRITFVYTGSTKSAVKKIHDKIGRGISYEFPPILWIEHLAWNSHADVYDFEKYRHTISLNSFRDYMRYGGFSDENEGFEYVRSVVQDTVDSVLNYKDLSYLSIEQLNCILEYIALCQLVFCDKNQHTYCTIPSLSKRIQSALGSAYTRIKNHIDMPTSAVALVCSMLIDSGLAKRMYTQFFNTDDIDEGYQIKLIDQTVPSLIFEYPWYASVGVTDILADANDTLWGKRVEDMLFLKMTYLYDFVDKYRFANAEEIDVVYQSGGSTFGIECKFRRQEHLDSSKVEEYRVLAKRLKLSRIDITCKDFNKTLDNFTSFLRIDQVVAVLELELINKRLEDRLGSPNVLELFRRYKFD